MRLPITLTLLALLTIGQPSAAARIEGTLVDAATQQGIAGGTVVVYYFSGIGISPVRTVSTDGSGAFAIDALQQGLYRVESVAEGYVARIYGGDLVARTCPTPYQLGYCTNATSSFISLAESTVVSIPMESPRAGRVRGRLLSSTAEGLSTAEVRFRVGQSENSLPVTELFDIDHVPAGDYVIFGCAAGKVCRDSNGTETDVFGSAVPLATVTVTPGLVSDLPDIVLQPEARIGVTVQKPAGSVYSQAPRSYLWREGAAMTVDLSNAWTVSQSGLRAGVYKIRVGEVNDPIWIAHWFGGPNCTPTLCEPEPGLPLVLEVGDDLTGLTTHVDPRQTISGRVTSEATGGAIAGVAVAALTRFPFVGAMDISRSLTDSDGRYTLVGVGPTAYFVQARANSNEALWIGEQWPEKRCSEIDRPYCGEQGQQQITVTLDQNAPEINFTLELGGRISGSLEDPQIPQQCVPTAYLRVYSTLLPPPSQGFSHFCGQGSTWTSGNLPAGSYWAAAGARTSSLSFIYQAFSGIECFGDLHLCNFSLATPITVAPGLVTPGVNFAFDTLELISRDGFD